MIQCGPGLLVQGSGCVRNQWVGGWGWPNQAWISWLDMQVWASPAVSPPSSPCGGVSGALWLSLILPCSLRVILGGWIRIWGMSGISGAVTGSGLPRYGFVGSTYKDGPGPVAAPPSSPCGGVAGVLFLHVSFALPSVPRFS